MTTESFNIWRRFDLGARIHLRGSGILPAEYLIQGHGEHIGDAERSLECQRVFALLDRGDGLACDADALAQLACVISPEWNRKARNVLLRGQW